MVIDQETRSGPIETGSAADDADALTLPHPGDTASEADTESDPDSGDYYSDSIPESPPPETVGGEPDSADEQQRNTSKQLSHPLCRVGGLNDAC